MSNEVMSPDAMSRPPERRQLRARGAFAVLAALTALGSGPSAPALDPPAPAPPASVRITSPSPSEIPYGETRIEVAVTPHGERRVVHIEIFADGVLLARDPLPPFEALWEAGERLTSRVIRAVALLDDGSRVEDLVATRGLTLREQILVEAAPLEHVELLAVVTDDEGLPVTGLSARDFVVNDRGEEVALQRVSLLSDRTDLPLSVALLVDRSGSMRVHMARIARAAVDLIGVMRPIDLVRVATFADEMSVLQDFTRDPVSLLAALAEVGPSTGGTSLFRAIHDTVRDMRDRPGRKVVVVLTDGLDTDFTSPSSPVTVSMYPILRKVAAAASRAGVTIVVILPGPTGRGYLAIQDLALQTGGWYSYPGSDYATTLSRLGERLLAGYVLEYDVARPGEPDRKRPVEVALAEGRQAGRVVHAAMGAYGGLDLFEALASDLEEGTAAQRARAARELGYFAGEEAAERLRRALDDGEAPVRSAAIASLSGRRDPEAMEEILDLLADPAPEVRAAAYEGAVRYGRAAIGPLADRSRDRGAARAPALRALGSIGGDQAAGVLADVLEDGSCAVRAEAALAAGTLLAAEGRDVEELRRESRSIDELEEALRKLLGDPCEEAAEAARRVLPGSSG